MSNDTDICKLLNYFFLFSIYSREHKIGVTELNIRFQGGASDILEDIFINDDIICDIKMI